MDRLSPADLRRLGAIAAQAQSCMDEYNRGVEHYRRGEWQTARDAFVRAASMGVRYVSARAALSLGTLLEEQWRDLDGARRAYEQAASTGHDTEVGPSAEMLLGNVHVLRRDVDAAFRAFRRAYQSGFPAVVPHAIFAIGMLYEATGDLRGARLAYEAALETNDPSVRPQAAARLSAL